MERVGGAFGHPRHREGPVCLTCDHRYDRPRFIWSIDGEPAKPCQHCDQPTRFRWTAARCTPKVVDASDRVRGFVADPEVIEED